MSVIEGTSEVKYSLRIFRMSTLTGPFAVQETERRPPGLNASTRWAARCNGANLRYNCRERDGRAAIDRKRPSQPRSHRVRWPRARALPVHDHRSASSAVRRIHPALQTGSKADRVRAQ